MFSIQTSPIPDNALLRSYVKQGTHTDCFVTDISGHYTHAEFVSAFYTTLVFRLERLILRLCVSRPSTDAQVIELAEGVANEFAAWRVEDRSDNQLLLCDLIGRTRSWLMIDQVSNDGELRTRLYFGSAVVPKLNRKTGKASLGNIYSALLGFHKIYSIVLLYAARSKLEKRI